MEKIIKNKKISDSKKGKKRPPFSQEWLDNLKLAKKRQKERDGYINSPEARKKLSNSLKGKPKSKEQRLKISGDKCNFWKGGVSTVNHLLRERFEYRQWRSDVYTRDDYICQKCYKRGGKLHAHHIKPLSFLIRKNDIKNIEEALECQELFNINNGLTLCEDCHCKTDTYGEKSKNYTN